MMSMLHNKWSNKVGQSTDKIPAESMVVQPPHDEHVEKQVIEQGRSVNRMVTTCTWYVELVEVVSYIYTHQL